jgi:hypothetical protein
LSNVTHNFSRHRKTFCFCWISKSKICNTLDLICCSSGSVKGQNLQLMKVAIMQFLTTLTPNDYINAIWYNSRRDFLLESCDKNRFIPATTQNKRLLQDFLSKIEERDQATLPPALNMSFNKFVSVNNF